MGFDLLARTKTKSLEPEWQSGLRNDLGQQALPKARERIIRAGDTYDGPLNAPMSDYQNQGMTALGRALDAGPATKTPEWAGIQEALQDQLGVGDDPAGKSYYQNYKTALLGELRAAEDRMGATRPGGATNFGNLGEDSEGAVAMVLARLAENDRARRQQAIPLGLEATAAEQRIPFDLVNASQQIGSLPRAIEQQALDADYQEWMRALNDLGVPLDTLAGLTTYNPGWAVNQNEGYLGEVAGAIGAILGGIFGGGKGAQLGYKAGNMSGKASDGSAQSIRSYGG
jgi:hypothetical protein